MICLVDMEHRAPDRQDPCSAVPPTQGCVVPRVYLDDVRRRLEDISGYQCMIRPYADVTPNWLDISDINALILSGNVTAWDAYDPASLQPLTEIVRSAPLPILGLCGGLQFIALAHGAEVGPIRELEDGEDDVNADLGLGYYKEWGFTPIRIVGSDPLFAELKAPVFLEAHYWEVKSVPPGFELLASTDSCRVQAVRRAGTLVYGTQFHPEAYIAPPSHRSNWLVDLVYPNGYTQEQPDGRQVLTNFFREARASGP